MCNKCELHSSNHTLLTTHYC